MDSPGQPLVSVVMPVRDAAGTVGRAVDSIRTQTLADWELIAVDDGSTDDTPALLEAAAREEVRIRVIRAPRGGLVTALNAGLAAAKGRFIARMDGDDESHPERLAEQVRLLETDPRLGVAGCLVEFGGDAGRSAGYALHVEWLNTLVEPDEIALNRFVEAPLAHPSVIFRRDLVAAHGGYRDGPFPEDYELWLRWLEAGVRIAKVPRPLLRWNDPPARLSRTDPRYAPEAFYRLKAGYLARWLRGAGGAVARPRGIWVWGAGRPTRQRAAHLVAEGIALAGHVDIDPKKTGRLVGGRPVVRPDELPPPGEAFVLGYVASRGARELIRADLRRRGHAEGRDFIMCA